MSLTKASYSMINGSPVNVLDYIIPSDIGTINDVSYAFTAAFAASSSVFIPAGTFYLSNVTVPSNLNLVGAGRFATTLIAKVNNQPIFNVTNGVQGVSVRSFSASAGSATGTYFWSSTGYNYTSFCSFEDLETHGNFLITFNANFISCIFTNIRDGYIDSPATTHQAINSNSNTGTNLCQVRSCQFTGSNATTGAVYLNYGYNWEFDGCNWEANQARCVYASGVQLINFRNCWFEANVADYVFYAVNSTTPSAQGSYPIAFDGCWINLISNTTAVVYQSGASSFGFTNTQFVNVGSGITIGTSFLNAYQSSNAITGAGASAFNTNVASLQNSSELNLGGSPIVAGAFKTTGNYVAATSGVAVTLFTITTAGLYIVFTEVIGQGPTYTSYAMIAFDGTGNVALLQTASGSSNCSITISGTAVKGTMSGIGSQNISYTYLKIA